MRTLSDQHTIEYEFHGLDISIDGLMFAEVSGTAELAVNDASDGSFYVKHITLAGERFKKVGPLITLKRREQSRQHLYRPAQEARTASAHLFRMIEAAIYEDGAAHDAWRDELEEAA